MVCGQFFGNFFNVNLAHHDVSDWQANLELTRLAQSLQ
jgi:hypothetical protein